MQEFIFGTLSTAELRQAEAQKRGGGIRHEHPDAPLGDEPLPIRVTVALPERVASVACRVTEPEVATIPLRWTDTEWDLVGWQYRQVWEGVLPTYPAGTTVRYTIAASPAAGGEPLLANAGTTYSYLVGEHEPPAWSREAIVYQIMPDRFSPGAGQSWNAVHGLDDVHGGTLRGIIEKLDYLTDLGVNCLWLNPFFPDETHHGYHATDYFSVNPRLGTLADIRELVVAAHKRGLRVLLDFVANHWGSRHETFQEALRDPLSDYVNWYYWESWPTEYRAFFGVEDLPVINVDYAAARAHLLAAADYWVRDVGFDGYRLDYAYGPSHDFWLEFRKTVKAARPDAWIFGEIVESPALLRSYSGRLDGCLDFHLLQALRETFAFQAMSLRQFDSFLNQHERYFPGSYSRPSFLDNHDMSRFLWLVGNDKRRLKLAALCQFTLSGPPVIYYGTEVGLSQERDMRHPDGRNILSEARLPMPWDETQDRDLLAFYRWLIGFRHDHPVLWRGARETVWLDEAAATYGYVRHDDTDAVLVLLNNSDQPRDVSIGGSPYHLAPFEGLARSLTG